MKKIVLRSVAASIVVVFVLSSLPIAMTDVQAGRPWSKAPAENAFKDALALDYNYGYAMTEWMVNNGPIVAGTAKSAAAAEYLAAEMERIGLQPGLPDEKYIEEFPICGWDELERSVTLLSPETRSIACAPAHYNAGTGPDGVSASLVFVDLARWDDFEKTDVSGKMILFHRNDATFYAVPNLAEAKERGAVGALMDSPTSDVDALKTDLAFGAIPAVYITQIESNYLQGLLSQGNEVTVKLVVNNEVGYYPNGQNVIGMIPGSVYPNEFVYLTAHRDHWNPGATDNCAGVGSLFGVAKAIMDSGLKPQRTLVFVAFDSEEQGGPADTWYMWDMGSYSHIVKTLDGRVLHPDLPGRIVAMLNMDNIGMRDGVVDIETTPELRGFFTRTAHDSGIYSPASTWVYWPPSSFDDWPFYMMGVPVMTLSWLGPAREVIYHTTHDVLANIDPQHFYLSMFFSGLCMIRLSEAEILPYTLDENLKVAEQSIMNLDGLAGDTSAYVASLKAGMMEYSQALAAIEPIMKSPGRNVDEIARINGILMQSAIALNPHMFRWISTGIPGWWTNFMLDNYANDLYWLNKAINDIDGNPTKAADDLTEVSVMTWGQYVGEEAYAQVLSLMYYTKNPLWSDGYLSELTDVHKEYMILTGRSDNTGNLDIKACLIDKRDAIYGYIFEESIVTGSAYSDAADTLMAIANP